MITIKNEFLTAKFNELGAEIKSLVSSNGKEYIWNGDEKYWALSSPILFPICSGLKNDEYYYNGKKYTLYKHGFARKKVFDVEELNDNKVIFLLRSDDETRKCYPFDFELRLVYELIGKVLKVSYLVKNLTDGEMYFSIGAHEGYDCPEGIEEYEVIFPQNETLDAYELDGNALLDSKVRIIENSDRIALKYDYFVEDALVFKELKSKSMILKNKADDKAVKLSFEGCDYFLIWTKVGAPYICLEPWCGITDSPDTDQNLKTKEGIIKLNKGEDFSNIHTIEILK